MWVVMNKRWGTYEQVCGNQRWPKWWRDGKVWMVEQRGLWRIISLLIFITHRERNLLLWTCIDRINTQDLTFIRRMTRDIDHTGFQCALWAICKSFTGISSAPILCRVSVWRSGFSSIIPTESSTVRLCLGSFFNKNLSPQLHKYFQRCPYAQTYLQHF